MDVKNLVMAVVGMVLAAVMIGGALLPSVASVTAESDTYTNDGLFYVDGVEDGQTINYRFENSTLYVNDVIVLSEDYNSIYPDGVSVMFTEHISIRYVANSTELNIRGQVLANVTALDFDVTGGTITGSYVQGGETKTANWTYTEFYGIVSESDRVMAYTPMYVNGDTEIFVTGYSQLLGFGGGFVAKVSGTINDGFTIELFGNSGASIDGVTSTTTVNYRAVNGHNDLFILDSVVFDLSRVFEDVAQTDTATFTLMTVPHEVTADRTAPLDDTLAGMLNILPIVAIAGLVMAGIYVFISRK